MLIGQKESWLHKGSYYIHLNLRMEYGRFPKMVNGA